MLSLEDNELLTHVGPETPMGELIRRFWFPVLLAEELPVPDCPPIRVKVLGEYFVAFRDTQGRLGMLDARCPHRGADLSMGFSEEGGIRCPRCYWKFDVDGNILDLPMEPDDSPLWKEVKARAFKVQDYGGLIWGYFGPQDDMPDVPEFEWTRVLPEHRHVSRFLVECNYMQGVEGGLDASRVAAIEKSGALTPGDPMGDDVAHKVEARSTDYGLMIGTALDAEGGVRKDLQVTSVCLKRDDVAVIGSRVQQVVKTDDNVFRAVEFAEPDALGFCQLVILRERVDQAGVNRRIPGNGLDRHRPKREIEAGQDQQCQSQPKCRHERRSY